MIKITYPTSRGAILEFEVADMKQGIEQLSFLDSLPKECPKCGQKLRFFFRSPKGNNYYGLICEGTPAHESNFGQNRDGGGLYYKNDWQNAFSGSEQEREINNPALTEPDAELKRLREEVSKEWASKSRSQSLDGAVRERYGLSLERLRISQLREILDKLRNPVKVN